MYRNIRRKKVGAMGNLPLRKAGEGCLRMESATSILLTHYSLNNLIILHDHFLPFQN